jgi:hypothetical protein
MEDFHIILWIVPPRIFKANRQTWLHWVPYLQMILKLESSILDSSEFFECCIHEITETYSSNRGTYGSCFREILISTLLLVQAK